MLFLIYIFGFITITNAGTSSEINPKLKSSSKGYNSVSFNTIKPDNYYQATTQQPPHIFPYSFSSKPVYMAQASHPPPALQPTLIIITHPSLIPPNLFGQMSLIQQMVSYFQNNPQAKHHLLYGMHQQQQHQPQLQNHYPQPTMQPYVQTAPVPLFQPISVPYQQPQNHGGHQSNVHYLQSSQKQQPQNHVLPIDQISNLAQSVAQQYALSPSKAGSPPAIITGLENFSPEQQAQIKAQLGLTGSAEQNDNNSSHNSSEENSKEVKSSGNSSPKAAALRSSYYSNK